VARLDTALWRAVAVFRLASLAYVLASGLAGLDDFAHPGVAVLLIAVMAAWTVVVTVLLERPRRRTPALLLLDLALAAGVLVAGLLAQTRADIDAGQPTLTLTWGAVPVLAWAVRAGPLGGVLAAVAMSAATLSWRQDLTRATVGSLVLLVLFGAIVGYVVSLARQAEVAYAETAQEHARQAERDRLSRQVHDGVLQVLALVSKSAGEPFAGLARDQERALRALVSTAPTALPDGLVDLRALLSPPSGVEVAAPGTPVLLPAAAAQELAAAVHACLDNVREHAGGRAWVLVEDEPAAVTVSVRDEGPGIAPGRLEEAAAQGRLGVTGSIRGRVEDLGGTVDVTSAPGQGTEVELRVPRP
jgi:signal transduction histidine kinase